VENSRVWYFDRMRYLRRLRISPALVVASIALAAALAGAGYAASTLPRNSVTTRQVKNRSLLAVDFKRGQLPRGPQGRTGPAGPAGPSGASGVRWALLRPDGTIVAQSGGLTVSSHSTGQYIIDFGGAVNQKLIHASQGFAGDNSTRGGITAGPCGGTVEGFICPVSNDTNHVIVRTYAENGTALENHSFYLSVLVG
jgi:hypothetical protein